MSTAPRYIHQLVTAKLIGEIAIYLKTNPIGDVVPTPGVIFSFYDSVIPDVIFISHARRDAILEAKDDKLHGAPELAVEILSPGAVNKKRDRVQKLAIYEEFGVAEYWIIDPRAGTIEVYRRENEKLTLAETFQAADTLTTPLLPAFSLPVKNLF